MTEPLEAFSSAYRTFLSHFPDDIERYASGQLQIVLPSYSIDFLLILCHYVRDIFAAEPTVLEISAPCVVIGDLHGQILDLLRVLAHIGSPVERTMIFLGDIVDRGEFSVETLTLVFLLKSLWPSNVFIVRGNHEFCALCSQGGFLTQVLSSHNYAVFQAANDAFVHLPLAARVGKILCLHGGLGPDVTSIAAIRAVRRPLEDVSDPLVEALVWSDPSEEVFGYLPSEARGAGYAFGESALACFLRCSNLDIVIRAHECIGEGFRWQFGKRLLTVFSASNYTGLVGNQAAVAEIDSWGQIEVKQFPPLRYIRRAEVMIKVGSAFGPLRPSPSHNRLKPSTLRFGIDTPKRITTPFRGRKLTT
jgi:protein phosphatase